MVEKKQIPIQLDTKTKAALDKHMKISGSETYQDAIVNLLGIKAAKPKSNKTREIYKEQIGPAPVIMDAAILRCWEYEARYYETTKDKTRTEIITTVRERMKRPYPNGTTWMSIYPVWFEENLESYVDDQLKSLKLKGFIDNSKKGVWTMISNIIKEDEWDLLRLVSERIQPHRQLNISDLLRREE
ncbi:MAG: hypothetical protein DK302_000416 [Chloroflexi bacterium]|jgi:hypothetical protein|nr:MAG: hypothetical protein DK302_000416 [Chloroflexota bacterium]